MIDSIVQDFRLAWFGELYFASIVDWPYHFMALMVSLLVILGVDIAKYNGIDVKDAIFRQQIVFRWIIYIMIMFAIFYWGHYGGDYAQTGFIYFQF